MRWLTKMSQNCALCFHIFQKMQNREQISDFFVPLCCVILETLKDTERFKKRKAMLWLTPKTMFFLEIVAIECSYFSFSRN